MSGSEKIISEDNNSTATGSLIDRLKANENLYYAFTNPKVIFGLSLFLLICLFAIFGPRFTDFHVEQSAGPGFPAELASPSAEHPFGLTYPYGYDVFTQTVYGLRATVLAGFVGGLLASFIGLIVGLVSGYKGGGLDEFLMGVTNVFLTFPQLAILIVIASYIEYRGIISMAILVAIIIWPWTARAVRAQTLSIKNEEHVDLSRISSNSIVRILIEDIAANMFSYIFMVFISQFMGTIMTTVGLEFLGLGPTRGVSLGLVMNYALNTGALYLGYWWWGVIPGAFIMLLVFSLYNINNGLDEVFNPQLREM